MPESKVSDGSKERLLGLLEGLQAGEETVLGRLDALFAETGQPVHCELLKLLTNLSYSNEAARKIWSAYEIHRATLQRRLGRDVGSRVALFDYLLNVEKRLSNPKIIELSDFEKTERSAITDHMTGLFNRAHFDACLAKEIHRCRRYGLAASLVIMDLDNFKSVNDMHGHPAGDTVLRDVGRLLIQRVREIDIAARYGGEEFGIILPETRRMSAFVVAERIRSEVDRYFRRKGRRPDFQVTLSGGVASYPDDAESAATLISRADEALYAAKREGKNRVSIYYREKRRFDRVDVSPQKLRVQLGAHDSRGDLICQALNISESGMLVQSDEPLKPGRLLAMRIALEEAELRLQGQVVRLEERLLTRKRKVYDAGIHFDHKERGLPEDLARFLRRHAAPRA